MFDQDTLLDIHEVFPILFQGLPIRFLKGGMSLDADATNKCNMSECTKDIEDYCMVL